MVLFRLNYVLKMKYIYPIIFLLLLSSCVVDEHATRELWSNPLKTIFVFVVVIALAVGGIFIFGAGGFLGEKITEILKIDKDGFIGWVILAICVSAALLLMTYGYEYIFKLF